MYDIEDEKKTKIRCFLSALIAKKDTGGLLVLVAEKLTI